MTTKDLAPGDVLVHVNGGSEAKVVKVDHLSGQVTCEEVGTGTPATYTCPDWTNYGYYKKPPAPQGLAGWLPQPAPAPAAPINMGPLMATETWTLPKPTRRQVSHNGKDWVDYRHLLDADDFESYTHRREI